MSECLYVQLTSELTRAQIIDMGQGIYIAPMSAHADIKLMNTHYDIVNKCMRESVWGRRIAELSTMPNQPASDAHRMNPVPVVLESLYHCTSAPWSTDTDCGPACPQNCVPSIVIMS